MAATKLQFKYGQWGRTEAIEMSKVAGVIVYSGVTRGIYVDGKEFTSGESANSELDNLYTEILGATNLERDDQGNLLHVDLNDLYINKGEDKGHTIVDAINEMNNFRVDMVVEEYAQATIEAIDGTVPAENASKLTIFGIGQGVKTTYDENGNIIDKNDGKIYTTKDASDDSTKTSLVINIAGSYDKDNNRLATEYTVNTAVKELRTEIFGTLDPEELDKTIDSIKEIQEMLKGGDFIEWTHEVENPETGEMEEKHDNVKVEPIKEVVTDEEGNPVIDPATGEPVEKITGYKLPDTTDEEGQTVIGATVAEIDDEGNITYPLAPEYENLQHAQNVEDLLNDINNIENEELVTKITVDENKDQDFVTEEYKVAEDENGLRTKTYTIGVNYGTFKTGHEEVHNEESQAYVNGIATVEDVQRYIEERFTWVTFESSVEEGVELTSGSTITNKPADANVVITLPENGTMTVENPIGTNKPIVVR